MFHPVTIVGLIISYNSKYFINISSSVLNGSTIALSVVFSNISPALSITNTQACLVAESCKAIDVNSLVASSGSGNPLSISHSISYVRITCPSDGKSESVYVSTKTLVVSGTSDSNKFKSSLLYL